MRTGLRCLAAIFAASIIGTASTEASAKCTRLAFSVNDYGKVGPTRDAKSLLDKYIAKWAADRGITNYRTGKKTVSCELFLDFGFFDEYTCRAEAPVCWGSDGTGTTQAKSKEKAPLTSAPQADPAEGKPAGKQPAETTPAVKQNG